MTRIFPHGIYNSPYSGNSANAEANDLDPRLSKGERLWNGIGYNNPYVGGIGRVILNNGGTNDGFSRELSSKNGGLSAGGDTSLYPDSGSIKLDFVLDNGNVWANDYNFQPAQANGGGWVDNKTRLSRN